MIQDTKKSLPTNKKDITAFKDDEIAPKGKIKHNVETDWPTKEAAHTPNKKRKIRRTENSRLP